MRWILLLLLVCLSQPGWTEWAQKFEVDLDGDGKTETVGLETYVKTEGGSTVEYGQLVVAAADGSVVWKGPRKDPFVFLGPYDGGTLELLADLDGDGRVDLLASDQKSDVRPTVFRRFVWTGKAFEFVERASLTPGKANLFVWTAPNPNGLVWLDHFLPPEAGKLRAVRFNVNVDSPEYPQMTVFVRPEKQNGFLVLP